MSVYQMTTVRMNPLTTSQGEVLVAPRTMSRTGRSRQRQTKTYTRGVNRHLRGRDQTLQASEDSQYHRSSEVAHQNCAGEQNFFHIEV